LLAWVIRRGPRDVTINDIDLYDSSLVSVSFDHSWIV
jgi:hypothetical protein